jgi:hypothetical protein
MPIAEPVADPIAESGDPAELSPSGPYRALKQGGLVLLCVAWIGLGLFGHDPWKPDDATSFGVSLEMLKHGDWLLPHLAGVALPDRPPLFYALAAATATAICGFMPLHDAARVAIALCLALTLWLLALAGRELYGRAFRWLPVLIFIGCIGLWDRAHQLSPDIGLLVTDHRGNAARWCHGPRIPIQGFGRLSADCAHCRPLTTV